MTIRTPLMFPRRVALFALPLFVVASVAQSQTTAQAPHPKALHEDAKQMSAGMSAMMTGPHHALAMAYRDNMATFARIVRRQTRGAASVDLDLARPAVAEMQRSFEQMQAHHEAHMSMMSDEMKSMMSDATKHPTTGASKSMMESMQHMDSHMAALKEHLTALQTEVSASAPSAKSVSAHIEEVLKHCAGMSGTPAKTTPTSAKPHHSL